MTLPAPVLDDRTFEQLRQELLARIPTYTPEWTDHNESDPGIALLELFASLGESLLFRFNQIPDTTKIQFLRLLGVATRPAQSASVLLTAETSRPEGVQALVGSEVRAGSVSFETTAELYAWPLEALGAGKKEAVATGTTEDTERRFHALVGHHLKPLDPATFYETVTLPTDPLAPDATPLTVSTTVDGALWVALLRPTPLDQPGVAGHTVFLGVMFEETVTRRLPRGDPQSPLKEVYGSEALDAALPPTLWQIWNGDPQRPPTRPAFTPLEVTADTTGGMTRTGVVGLALPQRLPDPTPEPPDRAGGEDSPPPLTDADQQARVVAWLAVRRPDPGTEERSDSIGRVRWVGLNAVEATQARTAGPELLGTGTGDPDQRFPLTKTPVLMKSAHVQVEEPDGWRDWAEVDLATPTTPADYPFVVDPTAGEVRFPGPRVPQIGQRIRVVTYRYGGGVAGNVAAAAVTQLVTTAGPLEAVNPLPAEGGSDAVDLGTALAAIPAEVHRRDRAVVDDDFRDLARQVAGVARADTLPLLHPDAPARDSAGVVSVVVFPTEDRVDPGAPTPDLALLRRVAQYLDPRRLLTTELYVIPPTYRRIAVSVGVVVRAGYQVDAVRRWVELIVRQFLAPVPPYGPDGEGWPLGRHVRSAELEAVAVQVEGVEYLAGLRVGEIVNGAVQEGPLIELKKWEVPAIGTATVVPGNPLPPGVDPTPKPPPPTQPPIVPLPPEVC